MSTNSWTVFEAKSLPCYGPDCNSKNVDDTCAAVVASDLKDEDLKLISALESHRILHAKHDHLEILNDLLGLIVPHNPVDLCSDFDIWVKGDE